MDSPIIGYRKVIVCIVGMVLIAFLAYSKVPDTIEAIKYIAGIVAVYCGINTYKGNVSDNLNTTKVLAETIQKQNKILVEQEKYKQL